MAGAQTLSRAEMNAECAADSLAMRPEAEFGAALFLRTPEQTWRRMQSSAVDLDFRALGDSVRDLWSLLAQGIAGEERRRMEVLLDTLSRELTLLEVDRTFRNKEGTTPRFFDLTRGDPGEAWLINGADNARAISLTPDQTSALVVRAVCWTSILAHTVAEFGSREARETTLRVLAGRGKRWENFDRHGYSLTPLELLINGWCRPCRGTLEPPRTQIVALHVAPSYVIRDSLGSRAALTTELLGLLFYNEERSRYLGLSYAFALPQEERRESGWLVHFSNVGQLGVSFRNGTYRRRAASLMVSADLYRFIETWQGKLRQERDEIRQRVARVRQGGPPQ